MIRVAVACGFIRQDPAFQGADQIGDRPAAVIDPHHPAAAILHRAGRLVGAVGIPNLHRVLSALPGMREAVDRPRAPQDGAVLDVEVAPEPLDQAVRIGSVGHGAAAPRTERRANKVPQ
jgi:hypothetical protein